MQFGMFMTPQYQPGADLGRGVTELVEQARAGREAGFTGILVGQHLVTGPEMVMMQTVPLMARLIPEIEGMRIGPGILLLSMMSPVMAAEEGATLDWMSDGNFVLACGLGYRPEEFEAMGTHISHRVARLEEGLEVVKRLWTEERVTHHGNHFDLSNVGCSVQPKQRPRPPIWLGGDVDAAIRRAARIADAWLGSPTMDIERLRAQLQVFAEARAEARLPATDCPLIRECFLGESGQHAAAASRSSLKFKYEAYAAWGHNDTVGHDVTNEFARFCENRFLIGDRFQIRDELYKYAELDGIDELILRVQWPGLDHRETLGNIERLGELIAEV